VSVPPNQERPSRKPTTGEGAAAWQDRYQPVANERETQFRAALTSGAAYLTLMAGSVVRQEGLTAAEMTRLRSAQALLSGLYAVVLLYYAYSIRRATLAITDDAARRLELEKDGLLPLEETRVWDDVRERRQGSLLLKLLPRRLWGLVPRGGVSQRQGAVFIVLAAILPLAWFSLRQPANLWLDLLIGSLAAAVLLASLRLIFTGCRHWWWVSRWDYKPRQSAFDHTVPRGWWRELLRPPPA
jgi:hypothetical protein